MKGFLPDAKPNDSKDADCCKHEAADRNADDGKDILRKVAGIGFCQIFRHIGGCNFGRRRDAVAFDQRTEFGKSTALISDIQAFGMHHGVQNIDADFFDIAVCFGVVSRSRQCLLRQGIVSGKKGFVQIVPAAAKYGAAAP